jgi:ubiquinone/menaquinone biosynthesis C-methylase UbiE
MKSLIAKAFGGIAQYYDRYMEETSHIPAQRRVAEFIAKNSKGLVLDVAMGTGIMLEPFKDGVGVDISQR